jgi:hypothetical protein
MAYDPLTKNTILYGGYNASFQGGTYGDTWAYTAGRWTYVPAWGPVDRSDFVLVYDPPLKGLLMYGGYGYVPVCGCDSDLYDTWLWSKGNWTQLNPAHDPGAIQDYAMAYDPLDKEAILYGGYNGNPLSNATWTFNGTDWTSLPTPSSMPALTEASMAYSPLAHGLVLTGGFLSNGSASNQTWVYRAGHWHPLRFAHTPRGLAVSMITTLADGAVLLFGGHVGRDVGPPLFSNQTYVFNGTCWSHLWTAPSPPPRMGGGLVYDASAADVIEFGGAGASGYLNDTWRLG